MVERKGEKESSIKIDKKKPLDNGLRSDTMTPPKSDDNVEVTYQKTNVTPADSKKTITDDDAVITIEDVEGSDPDPAHASMDSSSDDDISPKKRRWGTALFWIAIVVIILFVIFLFNMNSFIPTQTAQSPVVATVNGQPITAKDVDYYYNLGVPEPLKAQVSKQLFVEKSRSEER